tara:strand:+ start:320 stop:508 length:189 start_codon:yes stop_codon:yes gene_type:complete
MNKPKRDNLDYKYGIFYKLKDTGSRGWSDSDVREWCDKNDVYYESTDKRTDLIEKIKKAGFR